MKKDTVLELSKKLIEVPSETKDVKQCKKVLSLAESHLKDFTVERFEKDGVVSSLIYKEKPRPKKFKILLNAHLDVVPANKEQYKPLTKAGKLYGRGAYDMKAAAAAEILAFKELADKVDYPLGLQLVTDEETGGFNGTKYQIDKGVRADFVIAGEPTDMDIDHKEKGIMWFEVTAQGKSSHGAYPWNGNNAIEIMNLFLTKLYKAYPVPRKESWVTTVNVSNITTSNTTQNKVPDDCTVMLDVRFIPEEAKTVEKSIRKLLGKNIKMTVKMNEPAFMTEKDNQYVKDLQKSIKEVTGKNAKTIVKHGGSDLRHFTSIGAKGVAFGPTGAGHHSDDEWVDIKSLEDYHKVLMEFLNSFATGGELYER